MLDSLVHFTSACKKYKLVLIFNICYFPISTLNLSVLSEVTTAHTLHYFEDMIAFILFQAAYYAVQTLRLMFDVFSGYKWGMWFGTLDEKKWLTRMIFLETVAGVPGKLIS